MRASPIGAPDLRHIPSVRPGTEGGTACFSNSYVRMSGRRLQEGNRGRDSWLAVPCTRVKGVLRPLPTAQQGQTGDRADAPEEVVGGASRFRKTGHNIHAGHFTGGACQVGAANGRSQVDPLAVFKRGGSRARERGG